jgi:hypothetical protein
MSRQMLALFDPTPCNAARSNSLLGVERFGRRNCPVHRYQVDRSADRVRELSMKNSPEQHPMGREGARIAFSGRCLRTSPISRSEGKLLFAVLSGRTCDGACPQPALVLAFGHLERIAVREQ